MLRSTTLLIFLFLLLIPACSAQNPYYPDFDYNYNVKTADWQEAIQIIRPACRSEIQGITQVEFVAHGMRGAKAMCWQQPTDAYPNPSGHDADLTPEGIQLAASGDGSFAFNADTLPAGPLNIRIFTQSQEGKKDIFELQLYNKNGVVWSGIPDTDPPAALAAGLHLAYTDDFNAPLSISGNGKGARYSASPLRGNFSGWPFVKPDDPKGNPFSQTDTYLKIAARKTDPNAANGTTGFIASIDVDGNGNWYSPPCYLECRFTAQSATGTWPSFWTLTYATAGPPGDELDVIEGYGGVGKNYTGKDNPNHPGYTVGTHFHGQGKSPDHVYRRLAMRDVGNHSYWSTTFHTYGVYVGLDKTTYYLDDVEIFSHDTNIYSKEHPLYFMINYAIGGQSGWAIDLSRYNNGTDMYVDYVRVYDSFGGVNIQPIAETTGRVTSSGGVLHIDTDQAALLSVYTITGAIRIQKRIPGGKTDIPLPAGFYIVKLNDSVYKIRLM
ncbi:MAG: family 16 glycosylhydrolase [Candidatus Symbiothrix sp.]|jgi:hypothetical protein|nr:family 16 glycosylhydrolase [Candidatus Symbiothrix sp.]